MDIATDLPEPEQLQTTNALSYDDTVAYEQQLPSVTEIEAGLDPRSNENPLANRIGNTKIYLLSETSAAARKRNHSHEENEIIFDRSKRISESTPEEDGMEEIDEDVGYRTNAILLQGTPISQLPTARIFAYAKHFDTTPLGLEWVNDETCVLVYPSSALARVAFASLQKPSTGLTSEPTFDGFEVAKPIPLSLWPPTTRINKTLGTSSGLSGTIHMRWATPSDVKKKGAKHESEFYRRHGDEAGKEIFDGRDLPPASQRPRTTGAHRPMNGNVALGGEEEDRAFERQRLDAELDQFLRESESDKDLPMGDEITEGGDKNLHSPPSKMRSDYIADDGRTLLDRFSDPSLFESEKNPAERAGGLSSRLNVVPPPRQGRGSRGRRRGDREDDSASGSSLWERLSSVDVDSDTGMSRERRRGGSGRSSRHHPYERDDPRENTKKGGRRGETRPKKTQQELDDELDAFLKQE